MIYISMFIALYSNIVFRNVPPTFCQKNYSYNKIVSSLRIKIWTYEIADFDFNEIDPNNLSNSKIKNPKINFT